MSAMVISWAQILQPFEFDRLQQIAVLHGAIGRLLLACLLGGLVGLEREAKRKAAGVRTNMLICLGSTFFTLLSAVLAGDANPDKGRVASNIVQGIGFLGAGLILHNRSRVSGLTSAASVWVVASIGMACGAGLYVPAIVAAGLVIMALELVGFLERRVNIKTYSKIYEVRGYNQALMMKSILDAMDKVGERLKTIDQDDIGELQRVSFSLTATNKRHEELRGTLQAEPAIDKLLIFRDPEED
jgi:putative Mg2+ transporter-C (MgtC) family protein